MLEFGKQTKKQKTADFYVLSCRIREYEQYISATQVKLLPSITETLLFTSYTHFESFDCHSFIHMHNLCQQGTFIKTLHYFSSMNGSITNILLKI